MRELENIHFSLKAFDPYIRGRTVKFQVDNQATVNIVAKGSMRPACHQFAIEIFEFCRRSSVNLTLEWVPREENKTADAISRLPEILDTDDWGITDSFFRLLDNRWGPFTLDCFANASNAKCPKFFSLFLTPGTAGVDAFSFSWDKEFCLLVPPVALIGRCLSHLAKCQGKGVLIAPLWQSSFFWPLITQVYTHFVVDCLVVKGQTVLQQGNNKNSLLGSPHLQSDVIALFMNCVPA